MQVEQVGMTERLWRRGLGRASRQSEGHETYRASLYRISMMRCAGSSQDGAHVFAGRSAKRGHAHRVGPCSINVERAEEVGKGIGSGEEVLQD